MGITHIIANFPMKKKEAWKKLVKTMIEKLKPDVHRKIDPETMEDSVIGSDEDEGDFVVIDRSGTGGECCCETVTTGPRETVAQVKGRVATDAGTEHNVSTAGESTGVGVGWERVDSVDVPVRRSVRGASLRGRRHGMQLVAEEVEAMTQVELRTKGGRRLSTDDDDTASCRDSGLGNDSRVLDTWSSKGFTDSFEFHVISMAALNSLTNLKDSRLLRKFTAGRKSRTKTLLFETAWPSTVWYVPPPFEDQTLILRNLFDEIRRTDEYSNLPPSEKHILEAKFEIVSSEASYLKSLLTLEDHFIYSNELNDELVLSRSDKNILFAEIPAVIKCSKNFLQGFQDILAKDPFMRNIFQFVKEFAKKNFHIFIKYCSNLKYILETQKRLTAENAKFAEAIRRLQESPVCERLPLNSFLSLPLGRVVKLDLPVKEALKKMGEDHAEYKTCAEASDVLKKFGQDCNEGAKRFECMGDTLKIANKLDFPEEMPAFPISCSSRRLLKQGSLQHHTPRRHATPLHVFLFNDLLVVTAKQSDECYVVKEYCSRELSVLTPTKGISHLPPCFMADSEGKYLLLTIVKQLNSTIEMVLSCETESERRAWLEAAESETPDEAECKAWNRPRASVILPFVAEDPSQLSLRPGDEVQVVQRIDKDWYEGVLISDGSRGVFPGSHTTIVSVAQAHARALRKYYLLLNEETDGEESDFSQPPTT